jgi:hypothetical protein
MVAAIVALVLLSLAIILAVLLISSRKSPQKERLGEPIEPPLIQASGIYSIIRKSPREDLKKIRPAETEIRKYLFSINEDIEKNSLSDADRQSLADHWHRAMEENIGTIEEGDAVKAPFFYCLDAAGGNPCRVCEPYFKQGNIVTRKEIYKNPSVIPPFHLGCTTKIIPFRGKEDSGGPSVQDMLPLGEKNSTIALPDWTTTIKLPSTR